MALIRPSGSGRSLVRMAIVAIALSGTGRLVAHYGEQSDGPPTVHAKAAPAATLPRVLYSRTNGPSITLADGSHRRILSMLNIHRKMQFGEYVWNDADIGDGDTWIMVDLSGQTMSVFRAGHEIGSAPITYGADSKPTPLGVFPVLQKARMHQSNLYDAEMPFMLRLTWDGVAIHASNVQIGQATHGCIGVPPAFARLIFNNIQVGDLVSVAKA